MASLQKVLRPATCRAAFARQLLRPLSTTPAFRASVSNAPPRDPPAQVDIGVGELEGAKFKIEPMRRVGEDDKTMRARLVCMCSSYLILIPLLHLRLTPTMPWLHVEGAFPITCANAVSLTRYFLFA